MNMLITKKVAISNKSGKQIFALVDFDDFKRVNKFVWYLNGEYPSRKQTVNGKIKVIRLHRFILGKDTLIDHINNNPLDNRKDNLRVCTFQENTFNQKKAVNNTSGYKGVWFSKQRNKWTSTVRRSGERFYLGYFNDPLSCARAYDLKAKELFGDYAKTNF